LTPHPLQGRARVSVPAVQVSAQAPAEVMQPVPSTHDATQHSLAPPTAQAVPSVGVQLHAPHPPAPSQLFAQLSGLCQ
jgi:hypothetical protein